MKRLPAYDTSAEQSFACDYMDVELHDDLPELEEMWMLLVSSFRKRRDGYIEQQWQWFERQGVVRSSVVTFFKAASVATMFRHHSAVVSLKLIRSTKIIHVPGKSNIKLSSVGALDEPLLEVSIVRAYLQECQTGCHYKTSPIQTMQGNNATDSALPPKDDHSLSAMSQASEAQGPKVRHQ